MIQNVQEAKQDFAQLKCKVVELNTFMASDEFRNLSDDERGLIDQQVDGMYNYLDALGKRIADKSIYRQQVPFEAVDLGLPSGNKWATMNLGAEAPEQTGLYFTFDEANAVELDENWCVPTREDFQELYDNCDSEWVTLNGIRGRRFTSPMTGNSVFFPAAGGYDGTTLNDRGSRGYYWSSSFYSATSAYTLHFNSSSVSPQNYYSRRLGFSVRAVQKLPSNK